MLRSRVSVAAFIVLALFMGPLGAQAATLNLTVGGESSEFEVTFCRTGSFPSGQLIIEAEVTGTGTFRGQPAVLYLSRGTAATGGAAMHGFNLYLTNPAPDLVTEPTIRALDKLRKAQHKVLVDRTQEINADYTRDKLADLSMDEMMAKLDEQAQRLDALEAEMQELRPPYARSFGELSIDGSSITFEGVEFRVIEGADAAAFAGAKGPVRVTANCGD